MVSYGILFLLVCFVFSLVLGVKPPKNFGLLNLVVGGFTVLVSVWFGVAEPLTYYYEWLFLVMVSLVGVGCLVRGDGIVNF